MLKVLATPMIWVVLLMVIGLPLARSARRRRARVGWWLLLAGTTILLLFSLGPVANLLTYSLECRYPSPPPESLGTLDVVAVLGSGVYPSGYLRQYPELARESWPRFYHGVRYFRESDAGVIAFCGGVSRDDSEPEAEVMGAMAVYLGVPEESIVVEPASQNTMENAVGLAERLPTGEGRRIGLVTSATHMLRAKWVFETVFPRDEIVPLPVYSKYNPADRIWTRFIPRVGHLDKSTMALHEWLGILWYAVRY